MARLVSDWVGRSTFFDDLTYALQKLKPVTDFFSRQPEWVFYPLLAALILTGIAASATRWAPVVRALKAQALPPLAVPRNTVNLPRTAFGDMVRYIATDSVWGVSVSGQQKWIQLLDSEIVDQLAHGALYAYGRFEGRYNSSGTPKLDRIAADFWSSVLLDISKYFQDPSDHNRVKRVDNRGYHDLRVHMSDVERVWPRKPPGAVTNLPHLEEALEARREAQEQQD